MKISLWCVQCLIEHTKNFDFVNLEINDDDLYEIECINGHKAAIALQNEKFELLFDMGLSAFIEGYKQEAVACVHASMERFHEWCIKIFLIHNKVEEKDFLNTWKHVKRYSERQLGAFYFLYLQTFKKTPTYFKDEKTSFRNRVIHEGCIPKYKETYDYIDYVFSYIFSVLKLVKSKLDQSIRELAVKRQTNLNEKYGAGKYSITYIPSSLELFINERKEDLSLEKAIDKIKTYQYSHNKEGCD